MVHNIAIYLERAAESRGTCIAVVDTHGQRVNYATLHEWSGRLAAALIARGVRPGDRVGVALRRSARAVAVLHGILRAGAAYVPVAYDAPTERAATVMTDARVTVLFVDPDEMGCELRRAVPGVQAITVAPTPPSSGVEDDWPRLIAAAGTGLIGDGSGGQLAYLLYTSGSTGVPKGVALTHANAASFVEWCAATFDVGSVDRVVGIAPFHFDLSVFDLYVTARQGACLYVVDEALLLDPPKLAGHLARHRISVCYATPSMLMALMQWGEMDACDWASLRLALFAGEVFPLKYLREVQHRWTQARFFNLYGPTETNVCTYYEVSNPLPADQTTPVPIGEVCEHCIGIVIDDEGRELCDGEVGELCIAGPSVFEGYWGRSDGDAFLHRHGTRYYRTGDLVSRGVGGFTFLGRRDRMVKRNGYRIELGDIERALYRVPDVTEAAVYCLGRAEDGTPRTIVACVTTTGTWNERTIRKACGGVLPRQMMPDRFVNVPAIPRTSSQKVDYQRLMRETGLQAAVDGGQTVTKGGDSR